MKITGISTQQKDKNRVNVMVDGKYRFSLDIYQVADLGIRVGKDYSDEELTELETESQFGKLYARALEYSLMRPHSAKEMRDYLYRKTRPTKYLSKKLPKQGSTLNGGENLQFTKGSTLDRFTKGSTLDRGENVQYAQREVVERPGVSQAIATRVYDRLVEKGYIDDEKFTRYWVENRNMTKGMSRRKLQAELRAKGVESSVIEKHLAESPRDEMAELQKIITKKRARYPDDQKLMQYLARQGFSYDDIKTALSPHDR